MIGHVYCKFTDEEDASDALQVMNGRYYDGRKMEVEFSPVQNFQEVRTRDSHGFSKMKFVFSASDIIVPF